MRKPDPVLEAVQGEIDALRKSIDGVVPWDRILALGIAIVGGGATVAYHYALFIAAIPVALVLLFGYGLQTNAEMLARAGHKRRLEEEANRLLSRRALSGLPSDEDPYPRVYAEEAYVGAEVLHGTHRYGRLSLLSLQLMFGTLLLLSFALSEYALATKDWWYALVYGLALGIPAAIMLKSGWEDLLTFYEKGYRATDRALLGHPPANDSQMISPMTHRSP